MPSSSFGVARTLSAVLLAGAAACASSGATQTANGPKPLTEREQTLAYWQQLRDSITAQAIADEEGPRVKLRANYESFSGSRRLRASFTLEDDAYVLIGQLDAAGRLTVIFPESPDDDGFVRGGGKSYETAERFAGFDDEYFTRARYNGLFKSAAAQVDAYDRGSGYLFIVASWRPMRFDRISDGARFAAYDLDEYDMIRDPRPAIAELAALIAGDNREAYTLEFAQYYRSMSLSGGTFASAFSSGCYSSYYGGYNPFYGFSPIASMYAFNYGYANGFMGGCGSRPYYYFGNSTYFPGTVAVTPTPVPTPMRPIAPPGSPRLPPLSPHPRQPLDRAGGDTRAVQPVRPTITADASARPHVDGLSPRSYRDRGLMTTDDGGAVARPRASALTPRTLDQPSITDMVGRRRMDAGSERLTESRYDRPRNARESVGGLNANRPSDYRPSVRSYNPDAGMSSSRDMARAAREADRTYTPSYQPTHAAPSETRQIERPTHVESPRSSPPPAPRAEPARTPSPTIERPAAPRGEGGTKPTPNP